MCREIRNFVEGVFIDPPSKGELIGVRHIPAAFRYLHQMYTRSGEDEQRRLISALEQSKWNKVEAAKRLRLVAHDAVPQIDEIQRLKQPR
jgi:transcriptional regulator with GAF, ATPase, and Fis domain